MNQKRERWDGATVTNQEALRKMPTVALAALLADTPCPPDVKEECLDGEVGDCFGCWMRWLRAPVDDGASKVPCDTCAHASPDDCRDCENLKCQEET